MSLSFNDLLTQLSDDENAAAREVLERYSARLIALARSRLSTKFKGKVEPEDVMQSVFRTFFRRQREGEFQLANWENLWSLLVVITLRKCGHQIEKLLADRRDVRREAQLSPGDSSVAETWQFVARDPSPEETLALNEVIDQVLTGLPERYRDILALRLQGHTIEEVANLCQVTERTVNRNLKSVKDRLLDLYPDLGLKA